MTIKDSIIYNKAKYLLEYQDVVDYSRLERELCKQIYAVCFVNEKIIIVYNGNKGHWGLPGGTIETEETIEEALTREIQEETNMQVLKQLPIGYQKVTDDKGNIIYQLRSVCITKPLGDFKGDPAGDITEIKLISPNEYIHYFDWKMIGERIIQRAQELKVRL